MLQELAARTDASAWTVASMLFFLAAWLLVAVRALRTTRGELDARARLPFDEPGGPDDLPSGAGPRG